MAGTHGPLAGFLRREKPSTWQRFSAAPTLFLARCIYDQRPTLPCSDPIFPITVVCISDTHNNQTSLPDGDILIHAGDLTESGSQTEIQEAVDWLRVQPHRYKLVIAGNYETLLDPTFASTTSKHKNPADYNRTIEWGDLIYLQDSSTTLKLNQREISVYGSPRTPRYGNWAFQYPRSDNIWNLPSDIDILVTHGPPKAHLDLNSGCIHVANCRGHEVTVWQSQERYQTWIRHYFSESLRPD